MKKIFLPFITIAFLIASCEPVDFTPTSTRVPIYPSDTPSPMPQIATEIVTDTPIVVTDMVAPSPSAGTWWEVYFTDPLTINNPDNIAGSIEEKLIQFINNAQVSIHIAAFELGLTPVAEALIAAKNRGVDVKWITDNEYGLGADAKPGHGQFASLTAAGIEVRDDRGRSAYMHNKFWVFDGQIAWTGSTNITESGIFKQNNNVLVIHSKDVAYMFEREFNELWEGQLGPKAPSTVNNQWAVLDDSPIQILFSPEDHIVNSLIALVGDAKTSIRFLAFSFTDYPLAKAMIDRASAGVDVTGVYETFGSMDDRAELKTFWCAHIPVRQDGNPSFLHDKIIIIDDSIVVTGSLNFSSNADDSNEENVVIVENKDIAALYLQEFERIWNDATDVEPGTFTCQ